MARDAHHRGLARQLAQDLLARGGDAALAGFVDQAAQLDEANLERLERMIAERRSKT